MLSTCTKLGGFTLHVGRHISDFHESFDWDWIIPRIFKYDSYRNNLCVLIKTLQKSFKTTVSTTKWF